MNAAVVILNYNGKKHLEAFLPSVLEHTTDLKIYVADNASTDDSVQFLEQQYPGINLILLDKNYGFAGGYNRALAHIEADFYILLNSDVQVTSGWYLAPLRMMTEHPQIAAVQPKILSYTKPEYFEHAGAAGGFIDAWGFPFCRGRIFAVTEMDEGQYDDDCPVFWASGACMFLRAGLFKMAGGFDTDFFAHMEEIDLCWRFRNMGYSIWYTSSSKVYHLGGGTLDYRNPRKTLLNFRNNLFLLVKNLPAKSLRSRINQRLAWDTLAGIKFFAGLEFSLLKSLWQAHREFFSFKHAMLGKREAIPEIKHRDDYPEIMQHSLVINYFIKRNHKFSRLPFFRQQATQSPVDNQPARIP